jgi:hypothetical protein
MKIFFVTKNKILIITALILLLGFLFVKLMSRNQELNNLETNYRKLSNHVKQINKDLVLQYVSNVDKTNDSQVIDEIVLQLSPVFDLFLRENETIPYKESLARSEYARGYISAWSKCVTYLNTDEIIAHLSKARVKELSNDNGVIYESYIDFVDILGKSTEKSNMEFYNVGQTDGIQNAINLYKKIYMEISSIKEIRYEQNRLKIEQFEMLEESDITVRTLKSSSLQALIIIQKIIKYSKRSIADSKNQRDK